MGTRHVLAAVALLSTCVLPLKGDTREATKHEGALMRSIADACASVVENQINTKKAELAAKHPGQELSFAVPLPDGTLREVPQKIFELVLVESCMDELASQEPDLKDFLADNPPPSPPTAPDTKQDSAPVHVLSDSGLKIAT